MSHEQRRVAETEQGNNERTREPDGCARGGGHRAGQALDHHVLDGAASIRSVLARARLFSPGRTGRLVKSSTRTCSHTSPLS